MALTTLQTSLRSQLEKVARSNWFGAVKAVIGLTVEVTGISQAVCIGSIVKIESFKSHKQIYGEVIGFKDQTTVIMGYQHLDGIRPGAKVSALQKNLSIFPHDDWCGRLLNGMGEPIDNGPPLLEGTKAYPLKALPQPPQLRRRVKKRMYTGIRAIDMFMPLAEGQRAGIYAAAGVGKTTLIGQLTRQANFDVIVVGLIGERGREFMEFIQDNLGAEGRKKAIVISETSDSPALLRRRAGYLAMTLAEFFRDQQKRVLCIMDSITRFAFAQREIGLANGEPATTRGYPPSVFSELVRLLERGGNTEHNGSITLLSSVLVEADDHDDPIADAVRSTIDGDIILDRQIAYKGRYPAINLLKSFSRISMENESELQVLVRKAKQYLARYESIEEMIQIGAYKPGLSKEIDEAVRVYPLLESLIAQSTETKSDMKQDIISLKAILDDGKKAQKIA